VLGNLVMILAIISDSHLHTSMCFFPFTLSFVDIYYISITDTEMLMNIQTDRKVITYEDCITQIYFFALFGVLDRV
jgi:olfactory receptor